MRGLLVLVAGVPLLVAGVFSYLILPGLIESRLAADLQRSYRLEEKPEVEVSSGFPPEMLLGRIDRIEVRIDRLVQEGILLQDVRMDLEEIEVSLAGVFRGDLEQDVQFSSLVAEVPEASINEYLRENDLGLGEGRIDVLPQETVYRSADALLGLSASVVLDLRVASPREIEVIPREAEIAGIELPPFLARSLAAGGRTLDIGELPLNTELTSVEPSPEDALIVRAER